MNRYLEKIALRRSVAEYAKGKITGELRDLVAKGVFKSNNTYARGMKKGNDAIAKKLGTHFQKAKGGAHENIAMSGGGYVTLTSKKGDVILHNKDYLGGNKAEHQGMLSHELFESQASREKRKLGQTIPPMEDKDKSNLYESYRNSGISHKDASKTVKVVERIDSVKPTIFNKEHLGNIQHVGTHISPVVIARESEMVRKNPHLQDIFKDMRHGELGDGSSKLMKRITGKEYGTEKMTGREFKKATKAKPDMMTDQYGTEIPTFITNK